MAGDVLDGAGDQVVKAVLCLLQLDLLGISGSGGVNGLKGSGLVSQGLYNNKMNVSIVCILEKCRKLGTWDLFLTSICMRISNIKECTVQLYYKELFSYQTKNYYHQSLHFLENSLCLH